MSAESKTLMSMQLDIILASLKHSNSAIKQLSQILAQTITTGLLLTHTTLTLNSIVRSYSKSSTPIKAILIYNHFIRVSSIPPDNYTYPPLLKACTHIPSLPKAKEIHAHVAKSGLDSDIYVQNSLIHLYGSVFVHLKDARRLFDAMSQRDVVSWNSILLAYSSNLDSKIEALFLFKEMVFDNVGVDAITLVILLSACGDQGGIQYGRTIHGYVIKVGITAGNLNMENSLLGMYAKCGDMDTASRMFIEMVGRRDVVSCTILINGYVDLGLVDAGRKIFDQIEEIKDIALWNSMINGYLNAKRPKEALELFKKMEMEMVKPDETTMVSALVACASLLDLEYGRLVHQFILRRNIRIDVFVGTALVDMYSKCGCLEDAMATFNRMEYKDVFAWTAIITAFANFGHGDEALNLFEEMEKKAVKPNEATFVAVLMACSRSGLPKKGCFLFNRMVGAYKIQPKIEHFGCLVDLLSRAGLLYQAEEFIKSMPVKERLIAYKTLLSACINYSEIELGDKVAKELIRLGPQSHGVYILLSNFYALAGQWSNVMEMRGIMKEFHIKKETGISSIQVRT